MPSDQAEFNESHGKSFFSPIEPYKRALPLYGMAYFYPPREKELLAKVKTYEAACLLVCLLVYLFALIWE